MNPCTYNDGQEREVTPDVCEWHFEKQDPACQKCRVYQYLKAGLNVPSPLETETE
jgi:hypothetical protein